MIVELKNCPFCDDDQLELTELDHREGVLHVRCRSCSAQGPNREGVFRALEAWESRGGLDDG